MRWWTYDDLRLDYTSGDEEDADLDRHDEAKIAALPSDEDCAIALGVIVERLDDLGWTMLPDTTWIEGPKDNDPPRDGTMFKGLVLGCTSVLDCYCDPSYEGYVARSFHGAPEPFSEPLRADIFAWKMP